MHGVPFPAATFESVLQVDPPLTPVAESDFTETGVPVPTTLDVLQLTNVDILRRYTFAPPTTRISYRPALASGLTMQQVVGHTVFPLSSTCQDGQFSMVVRAAFFLQLSNNEFVTCQVDTTYTSRLGPGYGCFLSGPMPTATLNNIAIGGGGAVITADLSLSEFDVCICQTRAVKVVAAPADVSGRVMPRFA